MDESTQRARELLESVLSGGDPESAAKALLELGRLDLREGNSTGARKRFMSAVATADPAVMPQALLDLGELDLKEADPKGARQWLTKAAATGDPKVASNAKLRLASLELSLLENGAGEEVRLQTNEAPEEPPVTGLLTPELPPAAEPEDRPTGKGKLRRFVKRLKGGSAPFGTVGAKFSLGVACGVGITVGKGMAEHMHLVDWAVHFIHSTGLG